MPTGLLESQFAALQEPDPDEGAITGDIRLPADQLVPQLAREINAHCPPAVRN